MSRLLVISDNQEWLIFKISSFIKIPIKIFYQNVIFLITAGGGFDKDSVLSVSFGVTQAPPRSTMSQQVLRKGALVLSIPVSSRLGDGKKAVVHGVECSCRENTLTSAIFILVKQNCERQRCYEMLLLKATKAIFYTFFILLSSSLCFQASGYESA